MARGSKLTRKVLFLGVPSAIGRWWRSRDADSRKRSAARCGKALAWAAFAAGCAVGLALLERHVLSHPARKPVQVRLRLCETPAWVPDAVAEAVGESILADDADFNDVELVRRAHAAAEANPWISRVSRVEKRLTDDPTIGVLEVHAEFRKPVAKVLLKDGRSCAYVSDDAHRLPDVVPRYVASIPATRAAPARREYFLRAPPGLAAVEVHYLTINGASCDAPAFGERWQGEDILAAVKMIELLWDRPYINQIVEVDVRNFGWRASRREPQIRLVAKKDRGLETVILFGRLPDPEGDWVVPPERRLRNLDLYVQAHRGTLAGLASTIDIQGDYLTYRPY